MSIIAPPPPPTRRPGCAAGDREPAPRTSRPDGGGRPGRCPSSDRRASRPSPWRSVLGFLSVLGLFALAQPAKAAPGVTAWQLEGWRTDFSTLMVEPSEIRSVIGRDNIPSIDSPEFVPVASEATLGDREPVISLKINGDARAYPLRIMMWHEITNDVVGGVPVSITYCPLCNAAIVFERTVEGDILQFGTSGKLRHSDLIMYDRSTESWWQQFSGEGIAGVYAGRKLRLVPSRLESWRRFKNGNPNGHVLVPNNPGMRAYWRNPYGGYDSAIVPFLFDGTLPDGIPALERVVLVRAEDPFAIALPLLREKGTLREGDFVLSWEPGQASALDTERITEGRDVGNVTVERFVDGKLEPAIYDVTFAFVVNAFEPTVIVRTE